MTTICIHLFHHFIRITLLLLYKIAIINFLEELAYVRRRRNKKKKKKRMDHVDTILIMSPPDHQEM